MTEEEMSKLVEARLADRFAARLAADCERVRQEVIMELRREETKKWHDRVNARHPCEGPYAGLTREQHEARLKAMAERARADNEQMDIANSRPVSGDLRSQRAAAKGGAAGFTIKWHMATERDEDTLERESPEADPVRSAIGALLEVLIENTKDGSRARATAVGAVLEAHERIKDALRVGPTLNWGEKGTAMPGILRGELLEMPLEDALAILLATAGDDEPRQAARWVVEQHAAEVVARYAPKPMPTVPRLKVVR
jgi:hypothetical protein